MFTTAVLVIATISVLVGLYQKRSNAFCTSERRLDGKTTIVTGGTTGMGLEIAKDFARRGARVIIVCPFEDEGRRARDLIVKKTGNDNIVYQHLDLASFASVRKFAEHILKTESRLDILMNNAGVGIPGDNLTKDGLYFVMQVNYLGHFLLTLLLLPLLLKTGSSRIVNTASILHHLGTAESKYWKHGCYFVYFIYANSKYCVIPFSREMTRRLQGSSVVINSVDPGAVGTKIFNSIGIPVVSQLVTFIIKLMFKTAREGAQTAIYACVDDEAGKVSGELFKNCKLIRGKRSAYGDKVVAALWEDSVNFCNLTDKEVEMCFHEKTSSI